VREPGREAPERHHLLGLEVAGCETPGAVEHDVDQERHDLLAAGDHLREAAAVHHEELAGLVHGGHAG